MRLSNSVLWIFLAGSAWAADGVKQEFQPLPPPPVLDSNAQTEELEPQVTIVQKKDMVIEEYRIGGRLFKIKVIPKVGKPYYLVDERGDGEFSRMDGPDGAQLRPPRWVIHEF